VSIANVTLLATEMADLAQLTAGDSEGRAFALLHEHLLRVEALARQQGGALVKAVGDGALAAFAEPARALGALLELEAGGEPGLKLALHRGPARAATINEQLDYFGATVRQALALLALAEPGERLVGQAVMDDPSASALLRERGLEAELRRLDLPGLPGAVVHRLGAAG
jgi:class 3 adenylate cyclase